MPTQPARGNERQPLRTLFMLVAANADGCLPAGWAPVLQALVKLQ